MMQRGGQVVLNLLANVQQKTIEPFIKDTIVPGTRVYTDEYSIYARLQTWGYDHKSINHGRGEFARDDDGDGFCEVHVNTMEGFWSLLRSWLRPHRGISQEKLPLYLGFFEFVHNVRKRGKAVTLLVKSQICRKQLGHAIFETQKDRDLAPVKRALATVEILLPRLNQQSQALLGALIELLVT